MTNVSLYPRITELVNGERVPFHELMDRIKSDLWKEQILPLHEAVANGVQKKELAEIKSKLPYFTGSGVFSKREDKGLLEHSGKIIIDFDNLNDIGQAFELLKIDKYTEYIFKSCSGKGLAVVVNIEPDKHLDSFLFLEDYYKKQYNFTIDKACKDVSRPRYISYDPDLHSNAYYETVKLIPNSITIDNDEGRFDFALRVHDKSHAYVEGNRHNYLVVLSYWLNKCGVDENFALHRLVALFAKDDKTPEEINKIVTHCYKNVQEFGTFAITKQVKDMPPEAAKAVKAITSFAHTVNEAGRQYSEMDVQQMCAQHYLNAEIVRGIFKNVFEKNKEFFNIDNKPEIYRAEMFIKTKYEIIKNVVTQRTEYRLRAKGPNAPWEILNSNTIYRAMQNTDNKFTFEKLKSLLRSDFVPEYNPFEEYFKTLPEWDGNDYIDYLAQHVQTDKDEFWRIQFKKSLVRSIACTIGGRENRIVMTLVESRQNTGKTSFIRFLCPPKLASYYTENSMENSKDSELQLSESFIWNLEELAVLQNNEINKLKAIISRSNVNLRRPYAEFAENNPRRVNFWASTNRMDFLTDDQNTRWLCFNVNSISHDYNNLVTGVKNVDIDKVWSQAYALYLQGFNYQLTAAESQIRDTNNKHFENGSIEKSIIQANFVPGTDADVFMTPTDMLMKMIELTDNKLTNKFNIIQIGKAMKQLEFPAAQMRAAGLPVRGYYVKQVYSLGKQEPIPFTKQF